MEWQDHKEQNTDAQDNLDHYYLGKEDPHVVD
jgi:hypothetical protein